LRTQGEPSCAGSVRSRQLARSRKVGGAPAAGVGPRRDIAKSERRTPGEAPGVH
jgi:hypothetical protein